MQTLSRRQFHHLSLASALGLGLGGMRRALAANPNKTTKVALLLSGSIADGGWGQLAHEGIVALQSTPGFQAVFTENIGQAEIPQATRGYADDGYDLIIGHGYEYGSALLEIAPEYPDTKFFVSSFLPEPSVPSNIQYADLAYYDASYCAGALAALISEKRAAVGFVGGGDNPTQQRMLRAFVAGAERTVPGIKAAGIITGEYGNAARGRQAAATLIGNGADVIWHAANETGIGALQAAAAANVKALGCYADQTAIAPAVVGTSLRIELGEMVKTIAKSVADGSFGGGGEWHPAVDVIWSPVAGAAGDHNPKIISADAWQQFRAIWADVASGKLKVAGILDA
ncbi:BMP family ABC transporter substrate-binding protein [Corticibacter populi]|uniref:BMP family ABC transporter substrate-binding protein n=1 Tax=Corticibacter populi TaxID=1550736 RepID=A0A3M6QSG1_9BURK|nr:BMP family protein [Corticibacter populi]RMX05923.1 BMP family ABC transporter substrate-binding protein [Corticibacter populi]RZS30755.1 basic membrane protein A [Corticibacter populi]